MSRVIYAPRSAIHAYGAFLHMSAEADRPDAHVAVTLDTTDPRKLLRSAIPEAPPKLYRALDRAGDRVKDKSFYQRLERLCAGPLSEMLLSDGTLDDARLDRIEALLKMDPIVLTMSPLLARRTHEIEAGNVLVRFLRAHGVVQNHDDLKLPHGAGLPAILRRLQDLLDRIPAPEVEFTLPPPFRVLRSVGELRQVGVAFNNCTRNFRLGGSDHWFRLADGSKVYVASNEPPLLAAVMRVGPDLFCIDELCGPKNAFVDAATKNLLIAALHCAGVRLVQECPSRALSSLACANSIDEPDDEMDDLEAEVEEALAA